MVLFFLGRVVDMNRYREERTGESAAASCVADLGGLEGFGLAQFLVEDLADCIAGWLGGGGGSGDAAGVGSGGREVVCGEGIDWTVGC